MDICFPPMGLSHWAFNELCPNHCYQQWRGAWIFVNQSALFAKYLTWWLPCYTCQQTSISWTNDFLLKWICDKLPQRQRTMRHSKWCQTLTCSFRNTSRVCPKASFVHSLHWWFGRPTAGFQNDCICTWYITLYTNRLKWLLTTTKCRRL